MASFELIWYVEIKLLKTVNNFLTCLLNITKNANIKFNISKASEKHGYGPKKKNLLIYCLLISTFCTSLPLVEVTAYINNAYTFLSNTITLMLRFF